MKLIGIVLIVAALSIFCDKDAHATNFGKAPAGSSASANASANAIGGAGGDATGTLRGGSQRNMLMMLPGSASAVAPDVQSNIICPMILPKSKAKQNILFGSSEAEGYSVVSICVAHHLKDEQQVRALMCQDENWKAADAALGRNSCQ